MFIFTTDTRKEHCPIRIVYCDPGIVGAVHASHIQNEPRWEMTSPIALIKATEHSDYSGDSVNASNHRVLWRKFPHLLTEIYGSHGYKALAYDATLGPIPGSEDLSDMLTGLEEHAACDDDDVSNLEAELESEAWELDGRKDFRKALIGVLDAMDDDGGAEAGYEHELPDDDSPIGAKLGDGWDTLYSTITPDTTWDVYLHVLWLAGCDELNVNGGSGVAIQTGCSVHFYISEWCDRATAASGAAHYFLKRIKRIAKVCRISEGG